MLSTCWLGIQLTPYFKISGNLSFVKKKSRVGFGNWRNRGQTPVSPVKMISENPIDLWIRVIIQLSELF